MYTLKQIIPRIVCSLCGVVIQEGSPDAYTTYGMCAKCQKEYYRVIDTLRRI